MPLRIEELDLQELSRSGSVEVEAGSGSGFVSHPYTSHAVKPGVGVGYTVPPAERRLWRVLQTLRQAGRVRVLRGLFAITPAGLAILIGTEVAFYALEHYLGSEG